MKLVMTLLVRNEVDVIRANLEYHLAQGVDFVIVTDHGSDITLKLFDLLRLLAADPVPVATIDFRLAHPLPQCLRSHPALLRDRRDRRPFIRVLTTVLNDQADRPFTHLRRIPLVLGHRPILSSDQASNIPGRFTPSPTRASAEPRTRPGRRIARRQSPSRARLPPAAIA